MVDLPSIVVEVTKLSAALQAAVNLVRRDSGQLNEDFDYDKFALITVTFVKFLIGTASHFFLSCAPLHQICI